MPLGALFKAALAAAIWVAAGPASADAKAGRQKAQACAACHGALGLATMPNTPHLAGQPEVYLSEQLKAYRSGQRRHEVMTLIAKPLTDAEIADLSAWFASLKLEASEPK